MKTWAFPNQPLVALGTPLEPLWAGGARPGICTYSSPQETEAASKFYWSTPSEP